MLKSGQLFRSEGPKHLTDRDIEQLRQCPVRLICDLRSEGERQSAPNAWCRGLDVEIINSTGMVDLRARGNEGWEALRADPSEAGARRAMLHNYRSMPWALARDLRRLIDAMLVHGRLPALVHCTAGKDRTGFAIAMLLLALDIPEEAIYRDYLDTARFIDSRFDDSVVEAFTATFGHDPSPATLAAMTRLERGYLDAALESVVDEAGSIENYLAENMGLPPPRRRQLQSLLLAET